jgi:flagellar motor switch protein FliM
MSQILSQEEIDALLGGLDEAAEEEVRPTHAAVEEDEAVSYDFENSARLTRVKFPAFDIIHDQFNRGLRTTLSSILRLMVDTAVAPIEIVTFREFLRRVPVPSNLHILKMDPLRGHVMMVVDSQLVFCIVEVFLGSIKIGKARVEGREFTSIEQRLIQRVATSLFSDMEKAWQLIFPITIQYIRSEINPQFAKIAQDDDTCIISRFRIDLEEVNGSISICIPLSVLQPIKAKLQSTFQADERAFGKRQHFRSGAARSHGRGHHTAGYGCGRRIACPDPRAAKIPGTSRTVQGAEGGPSCRSCH